MRIENRGGSPSGSHSRSFDLASFQRHAVYPAVRSITNVAMSPWDSAGGDFVRSGAFASAAHSGISGVYEILLTSVVQAWADGKQPCNGLVIFPLNPGCIVKLAASSVGGSGGTIFVRYRERQP